MREDDIIEFFLTVLAFDIAITGLAFGLVAGFVGGPLRAPFGQVSGILLATAKITWWFRTWICEKIQSLIERVSSNDAENLTAEEEE